MIVHLNGVKRNIKKIPSSGILFLFLTLLSCTIHVQTYITMKPTQNKKSPQFNNKYNYVNIPDDKGRPKQVSQTIQNDSYSVRELLEKYTINSGYPVKEKKGTFDPEVTHETDTTIHNPDFDLTDETNLKNKAQITIEQAIEEQRHIKSENLKTLEEKTFQEKLKKHTEKTGGEEGGVPPPKEKQKPTPKPQPKI